MDTNGHEYDIRTLADFNKVPKGRRAACLVEFLEYLDFMDGFPLPEKAEHVGFKWKDDGIKGCTGVLFEVEIKGRIEPC
jgi:hypothetical protein